MDDIQWTMDKTMDNGQWTMDNEERKMAGQAMDNEGHKMVGRATDNGEGYPLINKGLHDMKPLCHRLNSHIVH
ncbi:MAG: hypothetical protein FWF88_10335 [Peptococcaceae bacterium]|nr:hypothetical protein [Peptococcaceae bacterium]